MGDNNVARASNFSGITSMYVLGEYILLKGFLIITNIERNSIAVMRDGIKAAKTAGRVVGCLTCEVKSAAEGVLRTPLEGTQVRLNREMRLRLELGKAMGCTYVTAVWLVGGSEVRCVPPRHAGQDALRVHFAAIYYNNIEDEIEDGFGEAVKLMQPWQVPGLPSKPGLNASNP